MSPRLLRQLIDGLTDAWDDYAAGVTRHLVEAPATDPEIE
jgi:hypothetical protein